MKQQTYLLINSVCYLLATTMLDEVLFRYDTVIYYWLTDWQYCVSSRRRYETLDIRIRRFESYISAAISDRRTPCYHSSPFSPYGFKIPSLNHSTTLLLYSKHTMFRCFKRIIHAIPGRPAGFFELYDSSAWTPSKATSRKRSKERCHTQPWEECSAIITACNHGGKDQ